MLKVKGNNLEMDLFAPKNTIHPLLIRLSTSSDIFIVLYFCLNFLLTINFDFNFQEGGLFVSFAE